VSGGEYLAAAYAVFIVVLVAYVAIIAAKLARLEREAEELRQSDRVADYAGHVPDEQGRAEGAE
jgi:CcmD family protein